MQNLLTLFGVLSFLAALVGAILPRFVLPFFPREKRTRIRALGIYLPAMIIFFILGTAFAPKDEADVYLDQLKAEAEIADKEYAPRRAEAAKQAPVIVKHSPERIAASREAVRELYAQLMAFKDDPVFHQKGFGTGLPYTHSWLQRVQQVDGEMSIKKGYSLNLASSAGYLRQLGMEYMRSHGQENQYTRTFRGYVEEGLAE